MIKLFSTFKSKYQFHFFFNFFFNFFFIFFFIFISFQVFGQGEEGKVIEAEFEGLMNANRVNPLCNQKVDTISGLRINERDQECKTSLHEFVSRLYYPSSEKNPSHDARTCLDLPYVNLKPMEKVVVNDVVFFLGPKIIMNRSRYEMLVYSIDQNGCVVPRLFYKSQSDGGWRVTPGSIQKARSFVYRKGNENHPNYHYVQETKLHPKILESIDKINEVVQYNDLNIFFTGLQLNYLGLGDNDYNVNYGYSAMPDTLLTPIQEYKPSDTLKLERIVIRNGKRETAKYNSYRELISSYNEDLKKLKEIGFVPDFTSTPSRQFFINHTILSENENLKDISVNVYDGILDGKPIEWHMAMDPHGRVWIDRISYKDCKVSTYGNCIDVIDSGILTNKPIEYRFQAEELMGERGLTDFLPRTVPRQISAQYVDITPALSYLDPIKEFKMAMERQKQMASSFTSTASMESTVSSTSTDSLEAIGPLAPTESQEVPVTCEMQSTIKNEQEVLPAQTKSFWKILRTLVLPIIFPAH
jgi:hypothetical protein